MPHPTALAFDFGERRIGVAWAERGSATASALTTLVARGGEPDWDGIAALVREWRPAALVIGVPRRPDGSDAALAPRARAFAQALHERFGLPAETVDESHTSTEAAELLRERRRSGIMQRRVRREDIDSLAAELIAWSWLRGAGGPVAG